MQTISPGVRTMIWYTRHTPALLFVFSFVRLCSGILSNSSDPLDVRISLHDPSAHFSQDNSGKTCTEQLHASLEQVRKRQAAGRTAAVIDLSGYALHQPMRSLPVDMYVTDIKVRTPGLGNWVQVRRCRSPKRGELSTHLEFSDLLVSGLVKLVPTSNSAEPCRMTLRLRRAGLDLRAAAGADRSAGVQLRTESSFVEPNFLSVHAYGCWQGAWTREDQELMDFPDSDRLGRSNDPSPEVRIISLSEFNDKELMQKILPDKLAAVLSVKKQFADQANAVFQAHGPFSQQVTPRPFLPLFTANNPPQVVPQISVPSFHNPAPPTPDGVAPQAYVSAEMEDIFLRGSKALLAKYLEKQLETPLKETIMRQIGYTVSYG